MKILFKNALLLLFLLFLFFSCRVEKRVYRNGYYVSWIGKKEKKVISEEKNAKPPGEEEKIETVIVSNASKNELTQFEKKELIVFKDTCGDVMYLKNGEKINVKVIEVAQGTIKYKRCDNLDGPLFTVRKTSVAMLQYYNGVKEDLEFEAEPVVQNNPSSATKRTEGKKQNPLGLASFLCVVAGVYLVIPFFFAMPLAIISLQQFKREPNKYNNKWMPRAALIISAVIYLLTAAILGLIAALSFDTAITIAALVTLILGIVCIVSAGPK